MNEQLPLLSVSDNGRGLLCGNKPFFWLGDTAWLLFQKCTEEEAGIYLANRKGKGFNVIQATLAHTRDANSVLWSDFRDPAYWAHVEKIVDIAGDLGLYMALLPCWGSFVSDGSLNEGNVEAYASFLAERFGKRRNVLWLLGGDVRGSVARELYCHFGRLLKEKTDGQLVAFHPFGRTSSSLWFAGEDWLDFYMFQSGHRRYDQVSLGEWDDASKGEMWYGEDNWKYVEHDLALSPAKPTVDGEPSYEQIPQGLHDPSQPRWQAKDVRRYAWWSVLAGAFGFTYGHNSIMQFFDKERGDEPSFAADTDWREAMHHEASGQMRHVKRLMEGVDFQHGYADDSLLVGGQREKYHRISVFRGKDYVICYDYLGEPFSLDLAGLFSGAGSSGKDSAPSPVVQAFWFDPVSGAESFIGSLDSSADEGKILFRPAEKFDRSSDWALLLKW